MATSNRIFRTIPFLVFCLIVPAGISLSNIKSLSLPISTPTAVAALILPLLTGAGIYQTQTLAARPNKPHTPNEFIFPWKLLAATVLFIIYDTVIATLAFTHMVPPDDLTCHLDRQWGQLFSNKNAEAIRRIQDAHQCCGLHQVKDRAWPFQDKNHGVEACARMFGRRGGCFGAWRRDEQISAGLLLLVAALTFVIKIIVFLLYRSRPSFFQHTQNRYPAITVGDGEAGSVDGDHAQTNGVRGRIESGYHDDPEEGAETAGNHVMPARASTDHGPIVQPSRLRGEGNEWEGS